MPRILPVFLSLLLAACQSVKKSPSPDVPAAIPVSDLDRISLALSSAPSSLAVFEPVLAASTLDPARSAVIVDLDRQRTYVYSASQLVAATRIASGKSGFRTPTGDFKIGQKNPGHSSNLYGKLVDPVTGLEQPGEFDTRSGPVPAGWEFRGAPMRHFMRFHTPDGKATPIGFHQGHVPRSPASHGCIRLPAKAARALYKIIPPDTPVLVFGVKHGFPARHLPEEALEAEKESTKKIQPSPKRKKPSRRSPR